jgi:hypothetical protein
VAAQLDGNPLPFLAELREQESDASPPQGDEEATVARPVRRRQPDESEQGGYAKVFGNGIEVLDVMPEDEFRLRSSIWWIATEFDAALKEFKRAIFPK